MFMDMKAIRGSEVELKDILSGEKNYGLVNYLRDEKALVGIDGESGERYIFIDHSINKVSYTDLDLSLELLIYNDDREHEDIVFIIGNETISYVYRDKETLDSFISEIESVRDLRVMKSMGARDVITWSDIVDSVKRDVRDRLLNMILFGPEYPENRELSDRYKKYKEDNTNKMQEQVKKNIREGHIELLNMSDILRLSFDKPIKMTPLRIIEAFFYNYDAHMLASQLYTRNHVDKNLLMYGLLYNDIANRIYQDLEDEIKREKLFTKEEIKAYLIAKSLPKSVETITIMIDGEEYEVYNKIERGQFFNNKERFDIQDVESIYALGKKIVDIK